MEGEGGERKNKCRTVVCSARRSRNEGRKKDSMKMKRKRSRSHEAFFFLSFFLFFPFLHFLQYSLDLRRFFTYSTSFLFFGEGEDRQRWHLIGLPDTWCYCTGRGQ